MATSSSDSRGSGPHHDAGARDADDLALGELLRRARERRGVSIEQISRETKIQRAHLEALERNDLSALPVGFYQRAEVRAYARAVDLDQSVALAKLDLAYNPPVARPGRTTGGTFRLTAARQWLLILAAVVIAAVAVARSIGGREPLPRPLSADTLPASASALTDERPAAGDPAAPPQVAGSPAVAPPVEAVTGEPAATQRDVPVVAPAPTPPPTPTPTPPSTPPSVPTPAPPSAAASIAGAPASSSQPPEAALPAADQAPKPGPAEPVTLLVLSTDPPGGRVTVDGIGWGIAPVTIRYLPAGEKRIRVSREGYVTAERTVTLVEGRPVRLTIPLRPSP